MKDPIEELPEHTYHAEFRCFTCDTYNHHIPTAAVAEDMAASHLDEYPGHNVRAWLCMEPVEIPIKRRKS